MPECLILNLVLFHNTVHIKEHVRKTLSSFSRDFVDLKYLLCCRHLQSAPFGLLFQFSRMENRTTGSSFSIFHRISVSGELCRKKAWLQLAFWSGISRQIYTTGPSKLLKCPWNALAGTDRACLHSQPVLHSSSHKLFFSLILHAALSLSSLRAPWLMLTFAKHLTPQTVRCSFLG